MACFLFLAAFTLTCYGRSSYLSLAKYKYEPYRILKFNGRYCSEKIGEVLPQTLVRIESKYCCFDCSFAGAFYSESASCCQSPPAPVRKIHMSYYDVCIAGFQSSPSAVVHESADDSTVLTDWLLPLLLLLLGWGSGGGAVAVGGRILRRRRARAALHLAANFELSALTPTAPAATPRHYATMTTQELLSIAFAKGIQKSVCMNRSQRLALIAQIQDVDQIRESLF